MRCVSCNDIMTSSEMGKKSTVDGQEYLMCLSCLGKAGLLSVQEQQTIPPSAEEETLEEEYYMEEFE